MKDNEELLQIIIGLTEEYLKTQEFDPKFRDVHSAYAEGEAKGRTAREMSEHYIVQQLLGEVDEHIFDPGGKREYLDGAYKTFLVHAPRIQAKRVTPEGEQEVLGSCHEFPASDGEGIVRGASEAGTEAARNYLHRAVIGHIKQALTRLSLNSGDVRGEAEKLCEEIMTVARMLEVRILV